MQYSVPVDSYSLLLRAHVHCNHAVVDNKHLCLGVKAFPGPQNGWVYALGVSKYLVPSSKRLMMPCDKYIVPCPGLVRITK